MVYGGLWTGGLISAEKERIFKSMQKAAGISGSTLKMIAVVCMLVDHTAAIVLGYLLMKNGIFYVGDVSPHYIEGLIRGDSIGWVYLAYQVMRRIIGRMAFPIYCFLLVEGFQRTGSRVKYAGRLFLFAVISEVPFNLAFAGKVFHSTYQNVFFTLLLGLLMIWGMEEIEKKCSSVLLKLAGWAVVFLAAAFLAETLYCDYGAHGMIAVALLYLFRKNKVEQIMAGCVAFLWEITAPLAFIFIALYNGKRGMQLKYFFYIFYPAHLLLLYLVTLLL